MTGDGNGEHDRARRFRDAALPYLDDVYSLARYLMRNPADAEDAAQECYVRALRHFDSYRGPEMEAVAADHPEERMRNAGSFLRRRRKQETPTGISPEHEPDAEELHRYGRSQSVLAGDDDGASAGWRYDPPSRRRASAAVPSEAGIVLREINDLSYHEIAEVAGVPVGTVMSRLARARSMLRAAWNGAEGAMP